MKNIELFTDGSCLNNPGPGGYGVILRYKEYEKELSQGYKLTTNNRMELLAVITGLEALKEKCCVKIYSDSQYVKNGITSWIHSWRKNGFKTAGNKAVKNQDLWLRLDKAVACHETQWIWVKGHNGHIENERCDILAKQAAMSSLLLEDTGYQL